MAIRSCRRDSRFAFQSNVEIFQILILVEKGRRGSNLRPKPNIAFSGECCVETADSSQRPALCFPLLPHPRDVVSDSRHVQIEAVPVPAQARDRQRRTMYAENLVRIDLTLFVHGNANAGLPEA